MSFLRYIVHVIRGLSIIHKYTCEYLLHLHININRKRELASVEVNPKDLEVVAFEMDISPEEADKALRENKGDLANTLRALYSATKN